MMAMMSYPPYPSIRALLRDNPAQVLHLCEEILGRNAHDGEAHRLAAQALRAMGRDEEAQRAELEAIDAAVHDPGLRAAAIALLDNRLDSAEPVLRAHLKRNPYDVAAIRMLAELAGRLGRNADAEKLLRRALELAPGFVAARTNLATVLHRQNKTADALAELDRLNIEDPNNPGYANLRAAVLGRIGEFEEAIALYEDVLKKAGQQPKIWMSYGHALKTVGKHEDSITAYRRAAALRPAFGEAWWSIANLKTARLDIHDIVAMELGLGDPTASLDDRMHLHFALGKAMDDNSRHLEAFDHYLAANRLRREMLPYSASETSGAVDAAMALFTPEYIKELGDAGCKAPDPVFIVGLPRSGSTLIEQILSSHSLVEGTMELPDIPALVSEVGRGGRYTDRLHELSPARLRQLGEAYIERTKIQRREGKPFFIDKLPNNWLYVGFIHCILPNAKIVDARRHPLDCGYSNFRQHFARGQAFSYDLADIGQYYADYVRLMRHFDQVMPGRVHRVIHEKLLENPETEVRRLLEALDLPFEQSCLHFYENQRPVRTASSEQVRRPINRDGAGLWRPVTERLKPLHVTLGELTETYADAT